MKGRFKDKTKQFLLIGLFLLISILTISLLAGRVSTKEIILISKNGIDISKNLDEQLEYFDVVKISGAEYKLFQESVVTDLQELKGLRLISELSAGSPIPKNALMDPQGAGVFASKMPEGRTVHLLSEALLGLPPVQVGDKINILLSYTQANDEDEEVIQTGLLMEEVEIYRVTDTSVYVDVSLEQDLILQTAKQLGLFLYQIPGQSGDIETNGSDYETLVTQDDVFEAILNQTYSNLSKEELQEAVNEINSNLVLPSDKDETDDANNEGDGGDDNNE